MAITGTHSQQSNASSSTKWFSEWYAGEEKLKPNIPASTPKERRILNEFSKAFPGSTVEIVSEETIEESRMSSQRFSEFSEVLTRDLQSMKDDPELLHRHRSPETWTKRMRFLVKDAFYV